MADKNKIKKEEEIQILNNFLNTTTGNNWCLTKKIVKKIEHESPDFLLKTQDNRTLGIEVTNFYVQHDHLDFSRILTRIGNKICQEIKKENNLSISIIIDKYDPRKNSLHLKDIFEASYNPGFSKLPPQKIFREKIKKFISNNINNIKEKYFIKQWIQIKNEYYQITVATSHSFSSEKYDCHVNNTGMVKFDPFDELQAYINKKNEKVEQYKTQCDECYLLIAVPSSRIGNYCSFTRKISNYKFKSSFNTIFLYSKDKNFSYILQS